MQIPYQEKPYLHWNGAQFTWKLQLHGLSHRHQAIILLITGLLYLTFFSEIQIVTQIYHFDEML